MGSWDAFLWPLLVVNTDKHKTIQLGVQYFSQQYGDLVHLQLTAASNFTYYNCIFIPTRTIYQRNYYEWGERISDKNKKHLTILLVLISAIMCASKCSDNNGDGMGYNHLLLSEFLAEINDLEIATNKFQVASLVRNETVDNIVTDSAAAATAFLCGQKSKLGYLGMDKDQNPINSIATILKKEGYKIGLITNTKFSDATPAAMYAHTFRDDKNKIIEDLIDSDFRLL